MFVVEFNDLGLEVVIKEFFFIKFWFGYGMDKFLYINRIIG